MKKKFVMHTRCGNCAALWQQPLDAPPMIYCRFCLTPSMEKIGASEDDGRIAVEED